MTLSLPVLSTIETVNFIVILIFITLFKFNTVFITRGHSECNTVAYSYEIRSWLLQGMRDAIVSGSCLVWILSTACVYYVSRKYWSRQLVWYCRILRNTKRSFVND
jgi:hypothetical protein